MATHKRDVPAAGSSQNPGFEINHKYLHFRRTKIVATIGPASSSYEMLKKLVDKGLNVARVNFSHGNPKDHVQLMARIRKAVAETGKSVAILADLCGPKIRTGRFKNDAVTLMDGSTVFITSRPVLGDEKLIVSQYRPLIKEVRPGHKILLDDGNLELEVVKQSGDLLEARVVRGGVLKNNKGMNLPDTKLAVSALTKKDKSDALYAIQGGADYIALSFVRRPEDILDLRKHLKRHGAETPVIAKIEKPEAIENIQQIMELADGIMVARGDLGVEMPPQKVPFIQNKLIQFANQYRKPVIVATQMLESMIEHGRPTRAEVTDVAGACMGGADAVMLSAETASGKFPYETLSMMDTILRETEAHQFFAMGGSFRKSGDVVKKQVQECLGIATAQLSRDLMARCIFVPTDSGYSARIISADRPAAPIIALTHSEAVRRKLNLLWGVYPHLAGKSPNVTEALKVGENIIRDELKLAGRGDYILMVSNVGSRHMGTNSIVVHQIA